MFALEISFKDGVSEPESILVRRPQALIGASEYAHVVIDDMKSLGYQLRIWRELGRRFCCRAVTSSNVPVPPQVEGDFEGEAVINAGVVTLFITALDSDLMLKEGEAPDSAGVQLMRRALAYSSPLYPALVVGGPSPMVVSFSPDQPIYIGRSKQCALRLDAADVSARHARMGFENGEFWVEDLGSTNGTYVNDQQISGRVNIAPNTPVIVGREISIAGVLGEAQQRVAADTASRTEHRALELPRYPVLISTSEVARPARLVLPLGSEVSVGRDSSCEMWLGAPHVSRKHLTLRTAQDGRISVTDCSTNGTAYNGGVLRKGQTLELTDQSTVFDLGSGVSFAICFNQPQEQKFLTASSDDVERRATIAGKAFGTGADAEELTSSIALSDRSAEHEPRSGFGGWLRNYFASRGVLGLAQLVCLLLALMLILYFAIDTVIRISSK